VFKLEQGGWKQTRHSKKYRFDNASYNQIEMYNFIITIVNEEGDRWSNNLYKFIESRPTEKEVIESFRAMYPLIDYHIKNESLTKYLKDNVKIAKEFNKKIHASHKVADEYYEKTSQAVYKESNYYKAIKLIEIGLRYVAENSKKAVFYSLRAKCNEKLLRFKEACLDLDIGIELLKGTDRHFQSSDSYNHRSRIKKKIKNDIGSNEDKLVAEELYSKGISIKHDDTDLPF
jgi:tetratricopeptide (TPR) repeat protein